MPKKIKGQWIQKTMLRSLKDKKEFHMIKEQKKRSMAPVLIWPNITEVVNIVFQEILALTTVRQRVNSKRVIVQIQM